MDYNKILKDRYILLNKAKDNTELQQIEIQLCKRDILYWFRNYLYTDKNTNLFTWDEPSIIPFIPFEFQEEFVIEIWNSIINWTLPISERTDLTNVFIEKSRQMWISWLAMAVFTYWFIFHNHKYHVISQKEDDVDEIGNIKSLMEKARFIIRNLPKWMIPFLYEKNRNWQLELNEKYLKYMNIFRSDWTWAITGESANPNASRWWTYNAIFLDEMWFMQNATTINTAAASATPCRIFNSTPNWEWNEFFRMRKLTQTRKDDNGKELKPEVKWLRYHWTEHPLYDKKWYEWKIQWMTSEKIAQELEISYNTAIEWRVYKDFPTKEIALLYNMYKPLYIFIDHSHWWADPHAVIIAQQENQYINIIDSIEMNCSVTDMAEFLSCQPKFALTNAQSDFFDRYRNYNRRKATFIGDPYDTFTTLNKSTIYDEFKKVWIYLNCPQERNKEQQIMKTKANIYRIRYNENCLDFASALMNARYPQRKETSMATTEITKPIHDWTSHYRSWLEYWVNFILENPLIEKKKVIEDDRPKRDMLTWQLYYTKKV